jgi:hypothetical protein
LDEYIRSEAIKIKSKRSFRELETFIWVNGRAQAAKNQNDDLIMSMAIACWVRDTAIIQNHRELESKKALIGAMINANKSFNTTMSGMIKYEKNVELETKRKQYFEHLWVIKG